MPNCKCEIVCNMQRSHFCNSNRGKEQSHLDTNTIRYATQGGISKISEKDNPLFLEDFGDDDTVTTKPQVKGSPV